MPLVTPELNKKGFHCPYANCAAYAKQSWKAIYVLASQSHPPQYSQIPGILLAACDHCSQYSIWRDGTLIFPASLSTLPSHPDLPAPIQADYEEARGVFASSPRSSAALLRLVIQKLCVQLGQPGANLNADIGALVAQGLPVRVQQSLDIVRVVGNNQVHPGVLDVRDDAQMATMLFELVNIIVEDRIAGPKLINALYAKLPENARKQIEERDAKPKTSA
jgi:hypothetical protein